MTLRQTLDEAFAPLRARWVLLAPREQIMLIMMMVFLGIIVLIYGVWKPSHAAAINVQKRYLSDKAFLLSMPTSTQSAASTFQGSLLSMASDTAAHHQLVLNRIEPEGNGVRIRLERADFNQLAAWMAELSAKGIRLQEAQIDRQTEGVSARLLLTP